MSKSKETILEQRAKEIALPMKKEILANTIDVVTFYLNDEKYAIESIYIKEIFPIKEVTPLPGLPPLVYGIINFRRKIISLVNLKILLQLPIKEHVLEKALILEGVNQEFAVMIDQLDETKSISIETLQTSLPTLSGPQQDFLKGMTLDQLSLLDGEKLLNDKRLIIQEIVG